MMKKQILIIGAVLLAVACSKEDELQEETFKGSLKEDPIIPSKSYRFLHDIRDPNGDDFFGCTSHSGNCLDEVVVVAGVQSGIDEAIENGTTTNYFASGAYEDAWPDLDQEVVDAGANSSTKLIKKTSTQDDTKFYFIVDESLNEEDFEAADAYYALPVIVE